MTEKIDRYQGFVLDGKGYIKDNLSWRNVVSFDFGMIDDDKAKKCLSACLKVLCDD